MFRSELWRGVQRRFAPVEYLGIHLTVGLLFSAVALIGFALIADALDDNGRIVRFDEHLAEFLHERTGAGVRGFFRAATESGSQNAGIIVAVCVTLALAAVRRWYQLIGWVAAVVGVSILSPALRRIFERPRPIFSDPDITTSLWGFPSGRAMKSLVFYGMLGYLITQTTRDERLHRLVVVVAGLIVLLIGASRLYLGVHYFSDVIAGYAAGAVWLTACITGVEIATRRARRMR